MRRDPVLHLLERDDGGGDQAVRLAVLLERAAVAPPALADLPFVAAEEGPCVLRDRRAEMREDPAATERRALDHVRRAERRGRIREGERNARSISDHAEHREVGREPERLPSLGEIGKPSRQLGDRTERILETGIEAM